MKSIHIILTNKVEINFTGIESFTFKNSFLFFEDDGKEHYIAQSQILYMRVSENNPDDCKCDCKCQDKGESFK
jgi:hypothetical protein